MPVLDVEADDDKETDPLPNVSPFPNAIHSPPKEKSVSRASQLQKKKEQLKEAAEEIQEQNLKAA